jgi:hypothetical protein
MRNNGRRFDNLLPDGQVMISPLERLSYEPRGSADLRYLTATVPNGVSNGVNMDVDSVVPPNDGQGMQSQTLPPPSVRVESVPKEQPSSTNSAGHRGSSGNKAPGMSKRDMGGSSNHRGGRGGRNGGRFFPHKSGSYVTPEYKLNDAVLSAASANFWADRQRKKEQRRNKKQAKQRYSKDNQGRPQSPPPPGSSGAKLNA